MHENNSNQIAAMLRSHVESGLRAIWLKTELETDEDDDYPFRTTTSACWVRIIEGDHPMVLVFGHAACGVPKSAKLMTELNDINRRVLWGRAYWVNGAVIVETTLHWTAVDLGNFERALRSTAAMCDDIGPMVAAVFGGTTPLQPEHDPADDQDAA